MARVAVLDLGTGNLHSVHKALEHVAEGGHTVEVTADPARVRRAQRVVLPGQGAIGTCIRALEERGLRELVLELAGAVPLLGICLGLQVLYAHSEEDGGVEGLDLLAGRVRGFRPEPGSGMKVPHMGWNRVHQTRPHPLWEGIEDGARFYFVHSFYADGTPAETTGETGYGIRFTSAAGHDNIFAVQFHPEKSQRAGLQLLRNFLAWDGS
ncbi:MAG: imidazole glycerol phosphate synthase subunit HisH [Gammaproteobacteria bacterium]|nr:imidazole glycerol phosphate synthase subunit HisH [Gammaproteobacteria bacterium]